MTVQMLYPDKVADAFVKQYYWILNKCPQELYRFYHDLSLLGWPGPDGAVTPVTTLCGIKDKIMSCDYKDRDVKIENVVTQVSLEGGVIVAVTGLLARKKDKMKQNFSQTFFLAKQENGFFVLNDVLRIFDICGSKLTNSDHVDKKVQKKVALAKESRVTSPKAIHQAVICGSKLTNSDHVDKKVQKKVALAKESRVTSPKAIHQAVICGSKLTNSDHVDKKVQKKVAPAKESRVTSPKVIDQAVICGSKLINSDHVDKKVQKKVALAKESRVTSPKAIDQAVAPSPTKASTPSSVVQKPSAPPNNVAPKLPNNTATNTTSACAEVGAAIYIRGLPYNVTKQEVAEYRFLYGFVEFESTDAARKAVEARYVEFGEKKAYIQYKRISSSRGYGGVTNDGRSQSGSQCSYEEDILIGPRNIRVGIKGLGTWRWKKGNLNM
ncbi:hypothetical protein ACJIZ3_019416 [Penstemon smallii]|uniref:NTF2 domain-containing protein n=1 Tax=Penstemon smallii TaxID=265156 RepID=A0ABD3T145_9LAMI